MPKAFIAEALQNRILETVDAEDRQPQIADTLGLRHIWLLHIWLLHDMEEDHEVSTP